MIPHPARLPQQPLRLQVVDGAPVLVVHLPLAPRPPELALLGGLELLVVCVLVRSGGGWCHGLATDNKQTSTPLT